MALAGEGVQKFYAQREKTKRDDNRANDIPLLLIVNFLGSTNYIVKEQHSDDTAVAWHLNS